MKRHILLMGLLLMAVLLTLFGQKTAFVLDETFNIGFHMNNLSVLVIVGSMLFVAAMMLATVFTIRKKLNKAHGLMYLVLGVAIGTPCLLWAFFVTSMLGG